MEHKNETIRKEENKPKCFGTLKPISGSCIGCNSGKACLLEHEKGYSRYLEHAR